MYTKHIATNHACIAPRDFKFAFPLKIQSHTMYWLYSLVYKAIGGRGPVHVSCFLIRRLILIMPDKHNINNGGVPFTGE